MKENTKIKSNMRFSFNNICRMFLKQKCNKSEKRAFKNVGETYNFFFKCFCNENIVDLNDEYKDMLMERTAKGGYFKQHSWLRDVWGTFLLSTFNVEDCHKRVENFLKENKIIIVKDFYRELKTIITADELGFTSAGKINNCSTNEYFVNFINDVEGNDVYTTLIFLLLISLYPGSYGKITLSLSDDHSGDLVEFIEQYKN